jgi:hypothetical protein
MIPEFDGPAKMNLFPLPMKQNRWLTLVTCPAYCVDRELWKAIEYLKEQVRVLNGIVEPQHEGCQGEIICIERLGRNAEIISPQSCVTPPCHAALAEAMRAWAQSPHQAGLIQAAFNDR